MKKTYEVIESSKVVNLNNETVRTVNVGEEVSGEFVLIDEQPYIELNDGNFVSTLGLAEKLDSQDLGEIESKVTSSNKKLIFALAGAGLGFGIAYYMKMDFKKKILFTVGGLVLGLGLEYINERNKK